MAVKEQKKVIEFNTKGMFDYDHEKTPAFLKIGDSANMFQTKRFVQ